MRVLLTLVLMLPTLASAQAAESAAPVRRVVLASNAARALIVETKLDGKFYFEHCYLPHSGTQTIAQELAAADYTDCVQISRPLVDNDATRSEFTRQFGESLNELFERHSRSNVITRTVLAGGGVAVAALVLPMLPVKYLRGWSARRILTTSLIAGGLTTLVAGQYSASHIDDLGLGREVEESLDSDLMTDVIFLDKQTKVPRQANQAISVFELAIDDATTATALKRLQ